MDTSKEYIKMCDCPEIQEVREKYEDSNSFYVNNNIDNAWLPRQDQLQDLLGLTDHTGVDLFDLNFFQKYVEHRWEKFKTMEQLWLAFYMIHEKYKTWDGKEWGIK